VHRAHVCTGLNKQIGRNESKRPSPLIFFNLKKKKKKLSFIDWDREGMKWVVVLGVS